MAAKQPLEFGLADFPPYFYLDDQGEPAGPVLTLADALFAQARLSYRLKDYPPARLYNRIRSGETQVTMAGEHHPEITEYALPGSIPLLNLTLNVYRHTDTPPIDKIADLAGHSVILIGAYTYGALSKALEDPQMKVNLSRAATHQAALQMLLHHRAEYLINYAEPMNAPLRGVPEGVIASDTLARIAVFLFVANAAEQPEALRDTLEEALSRLRDNGELQRILNTADYSN